MKRVLDHLFVGSKTENVGNTQEFAIFVESETQLMFQVEIEGLLTTVTLLSDATVFFDIMLFLDFQHLQFS